MDVTRSDLRVLVATDGSADASAAVAWVAVLPLAASVKLRAFSVERTFSWSVREGSGRSHGFSSAACPSMWYTTRRAPC